MDFKFKKKEKIWTKHKKIQKVQQKLKHTIYVHCYELLFFSLDSAEPKFWVGGGDGNNMKVEQRQEHEHEIVGPWALSSHTHLMEQ